MSLLNDYICSNLGWAIITDQYQGFFIVFTYLLTHLNIVELLLVSSKIIYTNGIKVSFIR